MKSVGNKETALIPGFATNPLIRRYLNGWSVASYFICLLLAIPVITIIYGVIQGPGASWSHLQQTVLSSYVINSLLLVLGTALLTLILGISLAWLITNFEFPGRRMFSWLLILPLAIPTYIMAYSYVGLLDYTGPIQSLIRNTWGLNLASWFDIMNLPGAIFVMSLVLYPYVYLLAKASFASQSSNIIEASRTLGRSRIKTFWKVALPVSRPAAIAGVTLVILEVLNDYGAVYYFGVPTFTTGIFRAWFSLGEVNTAIYLAGLLLVVVAIVLAVERRSRGRSKFSSTGTSTIARISLPRYKQVLVFLLTALVFSLAFLLPVAQMLSWSLSTFTQVVDNQFLKLSYNSILLAAAAALLSAFVGLMILFAYRQQSTKIMSIVTRVTALGYAIPGAIIAIGILVPLLQFDRNLRTFLSGFIEVEFGLILTGSVAALLLAYVVRFLAVAFNPIDAGFAKIPKSVDNAAIILGARPKRLLSKISVPLLRGSLVAAILLVFVDVMKELPLTLILRPFNFHTLATKTFELASDELVAQSANSSLLIIVIGLLPVFYLNRLMENRRLKY